MSFTKAGAAAAGMLVHVSGAPSSSVSSKIR